MITHNLKIAWRNLMKYKMQNLVSAVALAVSSDILKYEASPLPLPRRGDSGFTVVFDVVMALFYSYGK